MNIALRVGTAALSLLQATDGMPAAVATMSLASGVPAPAFHPEQVRLANIATELTEKSSAARYPSVSLYCSKVTNDQREKFRVFSGTVQMVAEARVSHVNIDGIEQASNLLADAVTEVLDENHGDWGNGMYYTGGYEVAYGQVKQGGRNFVQTTKVTFNVEVSSD